MVIRFQTEWPACPECGGTMLEFCECWICVKCEHRVAKEGIAFPPVSEEEPRGTATYHVIHDGESLGDGFYEEVEEIVRGTYPALRAAYGPDAEIVRIAE